MKSILRYLLRYRKNILIGIIALLVVDVVQLGIPLIMREIVGELTDTGTASLGLYAGLILAIGFTVAVFRLVWRYFLVGNAHRIRRDVRNDLFGHLLKMSARFFTRFKTGDLMAHATNDVEAVGRFCGFGMLILFDVAFNAIGAAVAMVYFSPELALYTFLPLPFLSLFVLYFGKIMHRRFKAVQEAFSDLMENVREALSGVRVIKSFGREPSFAEDFRAENQRTVDRNMDLVKVWGFFEPGVAVMAGACNLLLLWVGGGMVIEGTIHVKDFMAFMFYLNMLIWPMMAFGWLVNLYQRGTASMGRIDELLAEPVEIVDAEGAKPLPESGPIEVQGLHFSYPPLEDDTEPVEILSDVSFTLERGHTLGVVGLTGSGKSTLVRLLMRVYEPPRGGIRIGGEDVLDLQLASLRSGIVLVPQEPFLFSMSLRDNIRFGAPDASDEAVEEAAQRAGIHDEILEFPEGYETVVGERGITLSGGQRQRVSIARAVLLDPDILVLDDVLSAVDAEKEDEILGNLKSVIRDRTSIVISHRISAVQDAEHILVFEGGRVTEQGTHDQLVANDGLYARLHRLQTVEHMHLHLDEHAPDRAGS